ncbi:hypothetical protein BSK62_18235 [Paenibacillus odorifer]|nr:hypothetical protein BSK62_18235 [Paenibacillus odorifer]
MTMTQALLGLRILNCWFKVFEAMGLSCFYELLRCLPIKIKIVGARISGNNLNFEHNSIAVNKNESIV